MENKQLLSEITTLMNAMKEGIEARLDKIDTRLDGVESRLDNVEKRLDKLESEVRSLNETNDTVIIPRLTKLEDDVLTLKLANENIIVPQLNTIESCYLDTYKRYMSQGDGYEQMQSDIYVMKQVITDHSRMLQRHEAILAG